MQITICLALAALTAWAGAAPALGQCTGTVLTNPSQFQGSTQLITFDILPNGQPLMPGTANLDDEWMQWGLMISDSSPPDGARAYNTTQGVQPHSPPTHVAHGTPAGQTLGGYIVFTFVNPGTTTPKSVLEAGFWLQNGDSVENVEFVDCQGATICALPGGPTFSDQFIGLRHTGGISAIVVESNDYYLCDDLQFGGTVTCGNQPPTIGGNDPQPLSVNKNSTCPGAANQISFTATDPDGPVGSLNWSIQTQGATGTASFVGGTTGGSVTVCYQPNAGQISADTFVVRVQDTLSGADTVTVNVTVGNQAPVITQGDSVNLAVAQNSTCPGAPNQVALSATDPNDPSGVGLSWAIQTAPGQGSVTFVGGQSGPNVTVCYQPANGQSTPTSFVVRVTDAWNATDSITVNVSVIGGGPCNPGIKGDLVLDGVVNGLDINRFVAVLLNPPGFTESERCRADIGSSADQCTPDSTVNSNDVPGFIQLLLGGSCNIPPFIGDGNGGTSQIVAKNSGCPGPANQITLVGTDPDGPAATLTWSIVTPPTTGSASFVGGTSGQSVEVCYQPNAGQASADSYVVRVTDELGATGNITVSVTVTNAAPVITQGASAPLVVAMNSTCPGASNELALSATDADDALGTLAWSISTPPTNGTASFVGGTSGGAVTVCYQPNTGSTAPDNFIVTVVDPFGGQDTITINASIQTVPPVIAEGDEVPLSVAKNSTCPGAANQLVFNANDPDGNNAALAWSVSTNPTTGVVTFVGGSSGPQTTVCYQPNGNQTAADSFVVRVTDEAGATDQILVNVTVTNAAPVIQESDPISLTVSPGSTCANPNNVVALSASDADDPAGNLSWTIQTPPALGTASFPSGSTGSPVSVCYTPGAAQTQPASFVVRVTDGSGATDEITVNVTVQNAPPEITQGSSTSMNVGLNSFCPSVPNQIALNATDPDGPTASLAWAVQTAPATGTVSFVGGNSGGAVTICYAPNFDQVAADSFVIRVTDIGGATDTITVNVTVVNAPPVIGQGNGPLFLQVAMNSTCPNVNNQRNLSATDSDGLNSALQWSISVAPATGAVTFIGGVTTGANVTVCYQPNAAQSAADSFTVRVVDQFGGEDTIQINVTVLP